MKTTKVLALTVSFLLAFIPFNQIYGFSLGFAKSDDLEVKSEYVKQKEIESIDSQLESLLNLRDYYSNKMTRYRNRATRYELQGENPSESKTLTIEADKIQGVINQIDEEIAKLEKTKEDLLQN
jgi:hypothetical protein